ncbi:MAG: hypothetical protein EON54_23700 [Alcaligenaceae bacterium]|nr:MAG: hypothetical protein EON54_23700 [Alcaligenaceae bacterium]
MKSFTTKQVYLRYVPDSHNARSFVSRLLAPGGWPSLGWAGWLACLMAASWALTVLVTEHSRVSVTEIAFLGMREPTFAVTEANNDDPRHPVLRSLLGSPREGSVQFHVVDPLDQALEPYLTGNQEVVFGYLRSHCTDRMNGNAVNKVHTVCRPSHIQVGATVLLQDDARGREVEKKRVLRRTRGLIFLASAFIAGLLALGVWACIPRRD